MQRVAADDAKAHEAVVEVIRRSFLPFESVCMASRVSQDPEAVRELLELVRAALADGVSVGAYLGDDMVGVAVNKIQVCMKVASPPVCDVATFLVFGVRGASLSQSVCIKSAKTEAMFESVCVCLLLTVRGERDLARSPPSYRIWLLEWKSRQLSTVGACLDNHDLAAGMQTKWGECTRNRQGSKLCSRT